jgi:hypothetical protein
MHYESQADPIELLIHIPFTSLCLVKVTSLYLTKQYAMKAYEEVYV